MILVWLEFQKKKANVVYINGIKDHKVGNDHLVEHLEQLVRQLAKTKESKKFSAKNT